MKPQRRTFKEKNMGDTRVQSETSLVDRDTDAPLNATVPVMLEGCDGSGKLKWMKDTRNTPDIRGEACCLCAVAFKGPQPGTALNSAGPDLLPARKAPFGALRRHQLDSI